MSHAGATLLAVLLLFGLAGYFIFVPPAGFADNVLHHFAIPFVLIACALSLFENLRTRTHIAQLVGALRSLMGRAGVAPTPEVKREAVEILIKTLRSENESARQAAARQLRQLTGQELGESAPEWERWWAAHREDFGKPSR